MLHFANMCTLLYMKCIADMFCCCAYPELIELTERLYVDTLPFDLSTYEIERIELQEVAIDLDGGVEVSQFAALTRSPAWLLD